MRVKEREERAKERGRERREPWREGERGRQGEILVVAEGWVERNEEGGGGGGGLGRASEKERSDKERVG